MNVLTVVGARPQFIKAAPVSRALADARIDEVLVHTGQHYDAQMSGRFFDELGMAAPVVNLEVGSGLHGEQTARMLIGLERQMLDRRPDWVLVYGDTNSTLAGALAAAKLHIPVAHVEAGLRSFNRRMPEEINRIVTDAVSTLLFAPTDLACDNLRREGVPEARICATGDVMLDATLHFGPRARQESSIVERLGLTAGQYVLATIHRAENTDDPARLGAIVKGLVDVSATRRVVFPVHPRTRSSLEQAGIGTAGLDIVEPLGFLDMLRLEMDAAVIATDSGGVQKEAFFHRVPCVTLREETEWMELVASGWNRLVPPRNSADIAAAVLAAAGCLGQDVSPYGHGAAADVIARALFNPQHNR